MVPRRLFEDPVVYNGSLLMSRTQMMYYGYETHKAKLVIAYRGVMNSFPSECVSLGYRVPIYLSHAYVVC